MKYYSTDANNDMGFQPACNSAIDTCECSKDFCGKKIKEVFDYKTVKYISFISLAHVSRQITVIRVYPCSVKNEIVIPPYIVEFPLPCSLIPGNQYVFRDLNFCTPLRECTDYIGIETDWLSYKVFLLVYASFASENLLSLFALGRFLFPLKLLCTFRPFNHSFVMRKF